MGWLAGYSKRKPITITGGASGAQTDFQLQLTVPYAAAMQGDFDDLRFTQADGTTLIDAWLESKVDSTSALPWAEFPTTPANTVEQTYYMYYGNAGTASDWNGDATFPFFDEFDDSLDAAKWVEDCGSVSESGGELTETYVATEWSPRVRGLTAFGVNYAFRTKLKALQTTGTHFFGATSLTSCASLLTGGDHMMFEPYQDGNMYTFTGHAGSESIVSQGAYNTNYHIYDIERLSGNVYFSIDDVLVETHTTNLPSGNIYPFFGARRNGGSQVSDWVFAHKYVANPPTYAFGAEESAPTGEAAPTSIFYGPFVGPFGGPL